MIALFLAPLYLLLSFYIWKRITDWMAVCHVLFQTAQARWCLGIVYLFFVCSILIAFVLPISPARSFMKRVSNYWQGVLMYLILVIGTADALRLLIKMFPFRRNIVLFSPAGHAVVGAVCFFAVICFMAVGFFSQHHIETTTYTLTVEKSGGSVKNLNCVLAADLHLGYNIGDWHMKKMVEKIAATLSGIRSKYGVYACYGNHDVEEPVLAGFTFGKDNEKKMSDPRMDAFLKKAGIRLLCEEGVLIDHSFYLYGRPDFERPGRGITVRKTPEEITENMDQSKPILILDHEPRELKELSNAGADVDLCGHTHAGQLFPGNLLTGWMWENAYGYLRKNRMHSIVTSGVGIFGPNMRVGTKSEICRIRIAFKE